jgi:hypothetical protein
MDQAREFRKRILPTLNELRREIVETPLHELSETSARSQQDLPNPVGRNDYIVDRECR